MHVQLMVNVHLDIVQAYKRVHSKTVVLGTTSAPQAVNVRSEEIAPAGSVVLEVTAVELTAQLETHAQALYVLLGITAPVATIAPYQ